MTFYNAPYRLALHQRFASLKQRSFQLLADELGQINLDLSCGPGLDAAALWVTRARIIGVEPNQALLIEARHLHGSTVEFHCRPAQASWLDGSSVDALRFDRVFQHIADQEPVLVKADRIMMSEGRLQLVDTDWLSMSLFLPDIVLERKLFYSVSGHILGNSLFRLFLERLEQHRFANVTVEIHFIITMDFGTIDSVIHQIVDDEIDVRHLNTAEEATWFQWKVSRQSWLSQNFLLIQATKI